MVDVSSFSSSESSTFYSEPDINLQGTKSRYLQESLTSYSDSRKPFPPYSEAKDFSTPFTSIETVVPEEPFSPFENVNPGKHFKSSLDGNNNQADDDNNRVYDAHGAVDDHEHAHAGQNLMEHDQEKAFLELFRNLLEAKGQQPLATL